ncbi:MAG: hypothetical protein ACREF3_09095 [Acetobacteraceae bacterium]
MMAALHQLTFEEGRSFIARLRGPSDNRRKRNDVLGLRRAEPRAPARDPQGGRGHLTAIAASGPLHALHPTADAMWNSQQVILTDRSAMVSVRGLAGDAIARGYGAGTTR